MRWTYISKRVTRNRRSARARAHAPIMVHEDSAGFTIATPEADYYDWQLPPPKRKIRRKKTLGAGHAFRTGSEGSKKHKQAQDASRADASAVPAPLTRQPPVNDDATYYLRYQAIMSRLRPLE